MINAQPIEMISEPNVWNELVEWKIVAGNSKQLWLQLVNKSGSVDRRYIPSNPVLKAVFQRRPELSTSNATRRLQQEQRSVEKTAIRSIQDGSMFYINLTKADSETILSGTVKFELTEGPNTTTWVQNWLITRELTDPGH